LFASEESDSVPSATTAPAIVPASSIPATHGWYFLGSDKSQQGPVAFFELQALCSAGQLSGTDLCWHPAASAQWTPANQIPSLSSLFSSSAAPSTASDAGWFYQEGKQRIGPLSVSQIQQRFSAGQLNGQTLGWRAGMTEWTPLIEHQALTSIFPPVQSIVVKGAAPVPVAADGDDLDQPDFQYDDNDTDAPRSIIQPSVIDVKRKAVKAADENGSGSDSDGDDKKSKKKPKRTHKTRNIKQMQTVYISGMPDDTTKDECLTFVRKCGMVLEDPHTGEPVVYLFKNDDGTLRGDGCATYLLAPSVENALLILDGAFFRTTMKVSVTKAVWRDIQPLIAATEKVEPKKEVDTFAKKRRVGSQLQQLGWAESDDELPEDIESNGVKKGGQRIAILKRVFTLADAADEPNFFAQLQSEIAQECAQRAGAVEKVTIFEHNPDGVIAIKFGNARGADKCVEVMHGRFFDGRRLECALWDGKTNFKVAPAVGTGVAAEADDKSIIEQQEAERLDNFGQWLEEQDE
jgi:HIV Tat-specific factor 1